METIDGRALLDAVEQAHRTSVRRHWGQIPAAREDSLILSTGWDDARKELLLTAVGQLPPVEHWTVTLRPFPKQQAGGWPQIWARTSTDLWAVSYGDWKWTVGSVPIASISAVSVQATTLGGGGSAVVWWLSHDNQRFSIVANDPDFGESIVRLFKPALRQAPVPDDQMSGAIAAIGAAESSKRLIEDQRNQAQAREDDERARIHAAIIGALKALDAAGSPGSIEIFPPADGAWRQRPALGRAWMVYEHVVRQSDGVQVSYRTANPNRKYVVAVGLRQGGVEWYSLSEGKRPRGGHDRYYGGRHHYMDAEGSKAGDTTYEPVDRAAVARTLRSIMRRYQVSADPELHSLLEGL